MKAVAKKQLSGWILGLFGAGIALLVQPARAQMVEVTPANMQGWSSANVQGGGTVAITGTKPLNGNGSLEFNTSSSSSKADFVHANAGADLLSTLTQLSISLYRDAGSTANANLAPAIRLFVDNGQATDRYSYLIWEAAYNGYNTFPTNSWQNINLLNGNFWQRAFKTVPPNVTIDIYNRTLANWLAGGVVIDGDGDVSNIVGPNARVLGYEIGVGLVRHEPDVRR